MQSDAFQILLNKPNCSGRGVCLKAIGPDGRQAASVDAGKLAGPEATSVEYGALLNRELLKRSIVAVTKTDGLKTRDEVLQLPPEDWSSPSIGELETGAIDELFTAKDFTILNAILQQLYDASKSEVDDIMGEALPVSEG